MAFTREQINLKSVIYNDTETGKKAEVCAVVPLGYDDGSGTILPVNFDPVHITDSGDYWEVTAAGYHYAVGQPPNKPTDGWVGFGGKAGLHWLRFRLVRIGYYDTSSPALDISQNFHDIGGAPTYARAELSQSNLSLTLMPGDDPINAMTRATWRNVWNTPGGGELWVQWTADGSRLKEEVVINQAARDWITANRPPSYFGLSAANAYLSFVYQIEYPADVSLIRDELEILPSDFPLGSGAIQFKDLVDESLFFMPLDRAYVVAGGQPVSTPLRKRGWSDTDGNDYLVVGAPVSEIAALPAGNLTFDPTVEPTVSASGDDGYVDQQPTFDNSSAFVIVGARPAPYTAYHAFMLFTPSGVQNGDTIDVAYVQVYAGGYGGSNVLTKLTANDADNASAPTSKTDFDGRTLTTAAVDWDIASAASWVTNSQYNSPSIVSVIQEIVDRAGYSAGNNILIMHHDDGSNNSGINRILYYTYDAPAPPLLHIEYTAGSGAYNQSVSGAIAPAGTLARQISRTLSGAVAPAGDANRQPGITLAGATTPTGAIGRSIARALSGAVAPAGTVAKTINQLLSGTIAPAGTVARAVARTLSGAVTPAGDTNRQTGIGLSGSISPAGALQALLTVLKAISGALPLGGTLGREARIQPAGALTPAGALARSIARTIIGQVSATGTLGRSISRLVAGDIAPAGALVRSVGQLLSGALAPAGTLGRSIARTLSGILAPSGNAITGTQQFISGAIAPAGTLGRSIARTLSGAVAPAGTLARQISRLLTGEITPAGALQALRATFVSLVGSLAPAGQINMSTRLTLAGTLNAAGTLAREIRKIVSGQLTPSGVLNSVRAAYITITGAVTPAGAVIRGIGVQLSGALSAAGTLGRHIGKLLRGILTPAGQGSGSTTIIPAYVDVIIIVPAEDRTATVAAESRLIVVPAEDRTITV